VLELYLREWGNRRLRIWGRKGQYMGGVPASHGGILVEYPYLAEERYQELENRARSRKRGGEGYGSWNREN